MPLNPNVNRVSTMIREYEESIAKRLANGEVTQQQVQDLHKTLNLDLGEFCRFQELKSLAFAAGKTTLDEAQTIYMHLGNSVDAFNSRPLAVKVVLTRVFQELLEMQIRLKRRAG